MNSERTFHCRVGCGACCIGPSISSAIPGMPGGKPAGVRCSQLSLDNQCLIFDKPERPAVCSSFKASLETCGVTNRQALESLTRLDRATAPS